jgi:hypothetical protein
MVKAKKTTWIERIFICDYCKAQTSIWFSEDNQNEFVVFICDCGKINMINEEIENEC